MDRRAGQHRPFLGHSHGRPVTGLRVRLANLQPRLLPGWGLAGGGHGQERGGGDEYVDHEGQVPAAAARLVCPLPQVRHQRQVVRLHRQGQQTQWMAKSPRLSRLQHEGGLVRAVLRRLL